MTWDTDVEMMGMIPVYWAVLRNDDGRVEIWQSPYQQVPMTEDEIAALEDDPTSRKGLITYLMQPLSAYSDMELGIAARSMANLAEEDFILASLTNRLYRAMKEQREREGGYQPKPYDQEAEEA